MTGDRETWVRFLISLISLTFYGEISSFPRTYTGHVELCPAIRHRTSHARTIHIFSPRTYHILSSLLLLSLLVLLAALPLLAFLAARGRVPEPKAPPHPLHLGRCSRANLEALTLLLLPFLPLALRLFTRLLLGRLPLVPLSVVVQLDQVLRPPRLRTQAAAWITFDPLPLKTSRSGGPASSHLKSASSDFVSSSP